MQFGCLKTKEVEARGRAVGARARLKIQTVFFWGGGRHPPTPTPPGDHPRLNPMGGWVGEGSGKSRRKVSLYLWRPFSPGCKVNQAMSICLLLLMTSACCVGCCHAILVVWFVSLGCARILRYLMGLSANVSKSESGGIGGEGGRKANRCQGTHCPHKLRLGFGSGSGLLDNGPRKRSVLHLSTRGGHVYLCNANRDAYCLPGICCGVERRQVKSPTTYS